MRRILLTISCLLYSTSFLLGQGGDLDPSMLNGALGTTGVPQRSMKAISQVDPGTPLPTLDGGALSSFPLVITEPGSYYLTRNVEIAAPTQEAITVSANGVTLDLRGFTISATGASGVNAAIRITGEGVAVVGGRLTGTWNHGVNGFNGDRLVIENIRVEGVKSAGIAAGDNSRISNCTIDGTGAPGLITSSGISVDHACVVESCLAYGCDGKGIEGEIGCAFTNCTVYDNGGIGIDTGSGSAVTGCTAYSNGSLGFRAGDGSVLKSCVAYQNDSHGFLLNTSCHAESCFSYFSGGAGFSGGNGASFARCVARGNDTYGFGFNTGAVVSHCFASGNGEDGLTNFASNSSLIMNCFAAGNGAGDPDADGFQVRFGSRVIGCAAHNNGGRGIHATGDPNHIENNFVYSNSSGGILATGSNLVIGNFSTSNASGNYSHTGGNIGPVESASLATSPTANFE